MKRVDLAVVGAGPAGIAAAVAGAHAGLTVMLIDESFAPGGQVLSSLGSIRKQVHGAKAIQRGQQMLAELESLPINLVSQTTAWGIDGTRLALSSPGGVYELEATAVIIAAGGREFVPPFPGWTLPGVMTLGGAQRLVKEHGVLPGESILIAGAGPLLWALAATLLENDANVLAILDAAGVLAWLPALPLLGSLGDRMQIAWEYFKIIRTRGVPYHMRRTLQQAFGEGRLERVVAGNRTFFVDTLCVGYGFRPNIELLQLAGCALRFSRSLGGWIPVTDEHMRTDRPGVYAAGECTGIGGAEKSLLEGELAALAAAREMGLKLPAREERRLRSLKKLRQNEIRFARILNRACDPPRLEFADRGADPIVCRCESVHLSEVSRAIGNSINSLDGLKNALRVGQGICQGRTCGPALQRLLAGELNSLEGYFPPFHVRPPVKPVVLGQFKGRS